MISSRLLPGQAAALMAAALVTTLVPAIAAPVERADAAASSRSADPTDPGARVPLLRYTSSLQKVTRLPADPPRSWRDANDAVTRIGGWRAYAREAQQPDPLPPQSGASAPAATPAHGPHGPVQP